MALTFEQRTGNDPSVFDGDRLYDYEKQLRIAPEFGYTREMMDYAVQKWSEIPQGGKGLYTSMDRNVANFWRTRSPEYWAKQMAAEGVPIGTNPKFEEVLANSQANNRDISDIPPLEQRQQTAQYGQDYYAAANAAANATNESQTTALQDQGTPFDDDYDPRTNYGTEILWGEAEYIDPSQLPDVFSEGLPGQRGGVNSQTNWEDGYYYGYDADGNAFRQEIGSMPGTQNGTWNQTGGLPGGGDISGLEGWEPADNSGVVPGSAGDPPPTSIPPGGGFNPGEPTGGFTPGDPTGGWDWASFNPGAGPALGWGDLAEDYNAYERYQPGEDSPWGNPDREGGNKEFYQQQLSNLLRQTQDYQVGADKARERGRIRDRISQGLDTPGISDEFRAYLEAQQAPAPMDWSWLEGGLPDVVTGADANTDPSYTWGEGYTQGLTNQQVFDQASPQMSSQNAQWLQDNWLAGNEGGTGFMANWEDPNSFVDAFQGYGPNAKSAWTDFSNVAMDYTPGFSSSIPAGYASPNPGMQFGDNYGYQQGGATSVYNPITGAWVANTPGGF